VEIICPKDRDSLQSRDKRERNTVRPFQHPASAKAASGDSTDSRTSTRSGSGAAKRSPVRLYSRCRREGGYCLVTLALVGAGAAPSRLTGVA
jgi:hypothetical protein